MMNRYFIYMVVALAALGCQRHHEEPEIVIPQGKGALQIALRPDAGLVSTAAKAAVEDTYTVTQQELKASVLQGNQVIETWDPMSAMPPVVYFEPGSYTFEVETRGTRKEVNATPYYFGQTNFEITTGLVSSIYAAASLQSMVVSMTLQGGWAEMEPYKLSCFSLDKPSEILITTTDRAARLYIETPFPYGVRVEGRVGGVLKKPNVLVYDHLTVGTYHHLTLSDQ